ncbi:MAG TPA: hypothetical protein VNO23_16995, partial [Candidatus Binatia bacterium]|nr:hypothetical protein [Candidatus Binatia bacterium]
VADAAALLLLGYVLLWNVMALPASPVRFSERAQSLAYLLGLDQTWSMFAPHPLKNDGWYVLPARLRSGEVVDLMRGGRPVTWEKPQPASADYPNARWRRLMMALADHPEYAPAYADYVCRRWNRTHEAGRAVEELEIVFVLERTLPDYRSSEPRPRLLLRHRCPPETGRARSGPELFRPGREGADPDRRRA